MTPFPVKATAGNFILFIRPWFVGKGVARLSAVLALAGVTAVPIVAQPAVDVDTKLERLVTDYTRLYTRDSLPRWRELFLPSFTSASTTEDGGISVRRLDEFYAAQERGFSATKKMGERLENVRIERRGRMATVWADFIFWYDDEQRRGRLVLGAILERNEWKFQSLMFSYHE
jgi:hypothetical protein